MIAGKRARKRPLVRAAATPAVVAGTAADSEQKPEPEPEIQGAPPLPQYAPPEEPAPPASTAPLAELEVQAQLQQLTALREAGILTDEEFSAARQRLLGA